MIVKHKGGELVVVKEVADQFKLNPGQYLDDKLFWKVIRENSAMVIAQRDITIIQDNVKRSTS